jgi:NifU-like protein involved in Fe-S cluster formation
MCNERRNKELDQEKTSDKIVEVEFIPIRLKCVLLSRDAVREAIPKNKN